MIDRIISEVRSIAPQLPTGLFDIRAAEKLADEEEELADKLAEGDNVGALTELADVTYYAGKAVINGLIPHSQAEQITQTACNQCGVDMPTALRVMQAKYASRIATGKRDDLERIAVMGADAEEGGRDETHNKT
jgi:hypothetical protein